MALETLKDVVKSAASAVSKKATLPILKYLHLKIYQQVGTADGVIEVRATDLEVTLTARVQFDGIEVEQQGEVVVEAERFQRLLGELSAESVHLSVGKDETLLRVAADEGEYQIPVIAAAEFPQPPDLPDRAVAVLPARQLASLIEATDFCISNDELRPALTGIYIRFEGLGLVAVATDGHRLAKVVGSKVDAGEFEEMILPKKTAGLIRRFLPDDGDVTFHLGTTQLAVTLPDVQIQSRLIEGRYPNYGTVIPEGGLPLTVNRDDLVAAVKRSKIFANPVNHQVVLSLDDDKVVVMAEDAEAGGKGASPIDGGWGGEPMTMGFNAEYLLSALKHIPTDDVQLRITDPQKAAVLVPADEVDGFQYLIVVMPVRLT